MSRILLFLVSLAFIGILPAQGIREMAADLRTRHQE
jgi:hypothetical protein